MNSRFFPPSLPSAQPRCCLSSGTQTFPLRKAPLLLLRKSSCYLGVNPCHLRENSHHLRERFSLITWRKTPVSNRKLLFGHLSEGNSLVPWGKACLVSPEEWLLSCPALSWSCVPSEAPHSVTCGLPSSHLPSRSFSAQPAQDPQGSTAPSWEAGAEPGPRRQDQGNSQPSSQLLLSHLTERMLDSSRRNALGRPQS